MKNRAASEVGRIVAGRKEEGVSDLRCLPTGSGYNIGICRRTTGVCMHALSTLTLSVRVQRSTLSVSLQRGCCRAGISYRSNEFTPLPSLLQSPISPFLLSHGRK